MENMIMFTNKESIVIIGLAIIGGASMMLYAWLIAENIVKIIHRKIKNSQRLKILKKRA